MKNLYLLFISLLILSSCQKDPKLLSSKIETPLSKIDTTTETYKLIKQLGFTDSAITISPNYYIVAGDILFPRDIKNPSLKQARYEALVRFDKQSDIKVKIDNSIPESSEWRQAISQSIFNWNNITNCRINFTIVTSDIYDILIKDDGGELLDDLIVTDLAPYPVYYPVAAAAIYPSGGNPGNELLINLDVEDLSVFGKLSLAQKVYNISHNLGHCMGFLHTNVIQGYEYTGYNRVHIPDTPYDYDPESIMNYQELTRDWTFSEYDTKAIQYIYGLGRRICLKTSKGYYVQAVNGGGSYVVANSPNPWAWETFHLIESPTYGKPYYILQCRNGDYIQAVNGGGGEVVASNTFHTGEWEIFELVESPYYAGKYLFKTKTTGQYLMAINGGGDSLVASSYNPWEWESFEIINSDF